MVKDALVANCQTVTCRVADGQQSLILEHTNDKRTLFLKKNAMLEKLNEKFSIPDALSFVTHPSGLIQAKIATQFCTGSVFLLGGHVAEFQPAGQAPVLFMSEKSNYEIGKAIRGGVPICFPWFGPHSCDATAPAHGLVRTVEWTVAQTKLNSGEVLIVLRIDSEPFGLEYAVTFGDALKLQLLVRNTSLEQQSFEAALHTYFSIGDVEKVSVTGLEKIGYFDKLTNASVAATESPITFAKETDCVYQGAVAEITIHDPANQRTIEIEPNGSHSTVVWNPWIEKSQRMSDFGDQEYLKMCCVETANVKPNNIALHPGDSSTIGVQISASTNA